MIIGTLSSEIKEDIDYDILKKYLFLYRIKWSIIILKQIMNDRENLEYKKIILKKAKNYFINVSLIWGLNNN